MEDHSNADSVAYWDRVATEKTFTHDIDMERFRRRVATTSRVVDVGCGYGRVVSELAKDGYGSVVGFDYSSSMVTRGLDADPTLDLRVSQGAQLPLEAQSVDAVLLLAVLTCVPDDEAQRKLIAEVERVLRPGGSLFLTDVWLQPDPRNAERYEAHRPPGAPYGVFQHPEGATLRHHERGWIEELVAAFETECLEDHVFVTMNGNTTAGFRYVGTRKPLSTG